MNRRVRLTVGLGRASQLTNQQVQLARIETRLAIVLPGQIEQVNPSS
jgi:hypothetical protein